MLKLNPIKRNDSFSFYANFSDVDTGVALTGISSNLQCQARTTWDELVITFSISETSEAGTYLFVAPSTANLPLNVYLTIDIQYFDGTNTITSETFLVYVEDDITNG